MAITKRAPGFQPKVELFGDWDKTTKAFINLPNAIKLGSQLGKNAALKELEKQIKANIRSNGGSLGWKELSKRTLKNKEGSKYPTSILRMTGLYYRSITRWTNPATNTTYLGVKPRTYYPKKGASGLTVNQVANILENGSASKNLPARPLWKPTFKRFGGNARIKGYMIWHIRNQILLQCGVRARVTF